MKKLLTVALTFFLFIPVLFADNQDEFFDITSHLKLWLINNEAKAMSSISSDYYFIGLVLSPFAIQPKVILTENKAEEKLWNTHRKFYTFLDQVQDIYSKARRYGTGRFSIVFKQHRPELWTLYPFPIPGLIFNTSHIYRQAFHTTLLKSLNLVPERDSDLSKRLNSEIDKLSDREYRLFLEYIKIFSTLFPSNNSIRILKAFLDNETKKPFAEKMKDFLNQKFTTTIVPVNISYEDDIILEDPLAELEKLVGLDDEDTGYFDADISEEITTNRVTDSKKNITETTASDNNGEIQSQTPDYDEEIENQSLESKPSLEKSNDSNDMFKIWD